MEILKKIWKKVRIRQDRLLWLQYGFAISATIATFVAAYWHFQDRVAVKPRIQISKKAVSKEAEMKRLQEAPSAATRKKADKYYKMEDETTLPTIPDLPEDYDGK